jgi:hypothetical protein
VSGGTRTGSQDAGDVGSQALPLPIPLVAAP